MLTTAIALLLLLAGLHVLLAEQFRVTQAHRQQQSRLSAANYAIIHGSEVRTRYRNALYQHQLLRNPLPLTEIELEVSILSATPRSPGLVAWGTLATKAKAQGCYFPGNISQAGLRSCLGRQQPIIFSEEPLHLSSVQGAEAARYIVSSSEIKIASFTAAPGDVLIAVGDIEIRSLRCPETPSDTTQAPLLLYASLGDIHLPEDATDCLKSCRLIPYSRRQQSDCILEDLSPYFQQVRQIGRRLRGLEAALPE